jgi:uncharacterized protein (TIGR02145 family)
MNMFNSGYYPPNGDAGNLATYGYLYSYPFNPPSMCPVGWNIPTTDQFDLLNATVSSNGTALKAASWNGNNDSGFNALPPGLASNAGVIGGNIVTVSGFGTVAQFWTTSNSITYGLTDSSTGFSSLNYGFWPIPIPFASIRCLKQ